MTEIITRNEMARQVAEPRSPELTALIDMAHLCEGEMPKTYMERVEQLWQAFTFGQQREGWRKP